MSSTKRGYDRHVSDYYTTPKQCIRDFMHAWFIDMSNEEDYNFVPDRPDKVSWLDPCAGGDTKHDMSYPSVIKEFTDDTLFITTIDLREDSKAETKGNYLEMKIVPKPTVIITNPPFLLAEQFIRKALSDVKDDGYVVMLLRLNFFGSKARKAFFEEFMPERVYVHHRRMSFTDDGKTDSVEYMHAVWRKGSKPEFTKLKII